MSSSLLCLSFKYLFYSLFCFFSLQPLSHFFPLFSLSPTTTMHQEVMVTTTRSWHVWLRCLNNSFQYLNTENYGLKKTCLVRMFFTRVFETHKLTSLSPQIKNIYILICTVLVSF